MASTVGIYILSLSAMLPSIRYNYIDAMYSWFVLKIRMATQFVTVLLYQVVQNGKASNPKVLSDCLAIFVYIDC